VYSSNPEQVAHKFGELVSNLMLDIEQVGIVIARELPPLTYNRLIAILDIAEIEKNDIKNQESEYGQIGLW
jgi:hypothetical protein